MTVEHAGDSDARVGDLVFAAPKWGDPLGAMIVRLDGSRFSHVGIVNVPGAMASCRADIDGFRLDGDIGGVCIDTFAELRAAGRVLYLARTSTTDAQRQMALRVVEDHVERGRDHRSSFSFAKLFMVAAALNSYVPDEAVGPQARRAMLAAAVDGAAAWGFEAMRHPGFFCAEFVAVAYGAEFAVDDLEPPQPDPGPRGLDADPLPDAARWAERVRDEIPTAAQARALLRLVVAVHRHDRGFLAEAADFLVTMMRKRRELAGEDAGPPDPVSDMAPLPAALVTPRMLERVDWIDGPIRLMRA